MKQAVEVFVYDEAVHGEELDHARIEQPEHQLLLAMVVNAVEVLSTPNTGWYEKHSKRNERRKVEVMNWLYGRTYTDPNRGFSFRTVCDHLGMDPDVLRQSILQRAADDRKKRWRHVDRQKRNFG